MAVTYSLQATIFRSTNFDREVFRTLGATSGNARDEFSTSVDLTDTTPPTLPLTIAIPGIVTISFLVVLVTGGTVKITLKQNVSNLDVEVQGLMIFSGVNLTGLDIKSVVSGSPYCEIFGMGD